MAFWYLAQPFLSKSPSSCHSHERHIIIHLNANKKTPPPVPSSFPSQPHTLFQGYPAAFLPRTVKESSLSSIFFPSHHPPAFSLVTLPSLRRIPVSRISPPHPAFTPCPSAVPPPSPNGFRHLSFSPLSFSFLFCLSSRRAHRPPSILPYSTSLSAPPLASRIRLTFPTLFDPSRAT